MLPEPVRIAPMASTSGLEAVTGYLDERGVDYEVVEHETTYTAAEEARAAGVPPDHAAKTIALRDDQQQRLAVTPASERLDLGKVRELLGAGPSLRLATEEEIERDFPAFELGALPPLGSMLPAPEVIDRRLLDHDRILCHGGDQRHGVLLDPQDLVEIVQPQVADICED
jgi:Ala-tRNA(Pro) deacylase